MLLLADDMVIMTELKEGLQSNLQVLSEVMGRWDLKVNWKKTKVMKVMKVCYRLGFNVNCILRSICWGLHANL